jgi:hypothetical protein
MNRHCGIHISMNVENAPRGILMWSPMLSLQHVYSSEQLPNSRAEALVSSHSAGDVVD